jgi:RecB family endonuclease NucS
MPLYHFQSDESLIKPVAEATFKETKLKERTDLQRLLREHIEVLDKNLMVLAEEFGEDSDRRIDLLALDKDANLVVIELKRDDSAHMELQAI